jgi:hypothetical protein
MKLASQQPIRIITEFELPREAEAVSGTVEGIVEGKSVTDIAYYVRDTSSDRLRRVTLTAQEESMAAGALLETWADRRVCEECGSEGPHEDNGVETSSLDTSLLCTCGHSWDVNYPYN